MSEENKLKEIRWKQRFQNFERAYLQFGVVMERDTEHDPMFKQFFETSKKAL